MNPQAKALRERTQKFFTRVIRFCATLPRNDATRAISGQLLDAARGADSNYGAAWRARSTREFIAKLGVAAEEADESLGWLKALASAEIGDPEEAKVLIQEADELTAIFVASQNTAKRNAAKRLRRRSPHRNNRQSS
jgi:four helix bundle protein